MTDVERIRTDFVQLWGQMGPFWGVTPTTAQVFGWLLSREGGADSQQIMDALKLSRGAVSMSCKELRDWGLVRPEKAVGSRKLTYFPETDLEKAIKNIVQTRKRREWDPILSRLHEWIPELEKGRGPESREFASRLKSIEALISLADSMAESFLKGGVVKNIGLDLLVRQAKKKNQKKRTRG